MKKVERILIKLAVIHLIFLVIIQGILLPNFSSTSVQKLTIYEGVVKQGYDHWIEVWKSKSQNGF
ncbi:DUF5359 family protein [Mangrovibacillus cuniculi]|uniref:YpfB family protein n=1 Tax=Mangrovibacillus cuniculi TaxID=2593652 RepID=A0A7S8HFN8_9BACI|nr:DUF5359 family protein [Mangrovibacillus cuniculi]QPC46716.1 YpfB family protein [Mangrovibacillus cuniculi]